MRSQTIVKYRSNTSAKNQKRSLRLLLLICCAFICPSFAVLAETINPSQVIGSTDSSTHSKPAYQASSRTKVYFYNPEINTARNLVLKSAWDNYLNEMGEYELQPVDNGERFQKLIQEEQSAAFIMAEWLYSSIDPNSELGKQNLELVYIGMKNGSDTYRKVLVSNKNALDFDRVTIASSGSKDRTRNLLRSIYSEYTSQQIDNIKVLQVPKDIDALMAVGYGLAEMALTTEVSLSKMAVLNEELYKDMIVLRRSEPFKRSVLVFKSNNLELKSNLAAVLKDMERHPNGRQAMSLLGLDKWKLVDKTIAKIQEGLLETPNSEEGQNNEN